MREGKPSRRTNRRPPSASDSSCPQRHPNHRSRETQKSADTDEENGRLYLSIYNYFGQYAEDKEAAIKFRDKRIIPAIDSGKKVILDFNNVISAPHSFLSALIASPAKRLGMTTYKIIKITNATAEIRETLDFIFDENT